MTRLRPLLLGLLLLASSCGGENAATVDDDPITSQALDAELEQIGRNDSYVRHVEQMSGAAVRDGLGWTQGFIAGVLTRRIHYEVLQRETAARRLDVSGQQLVRGEVTAAEEVGGPKILAGFPADYRAELILRGALIAQLRDHLVRDEDPGTYYDAHRADFVKPCTRHLVVATLEDATAAAARVDAGEPFDAVASDVSLDEGTAPKGGDLGCNAGGDLIPELDRPAVTQKVGAPTSPIRTEAGWQILLVYRRTAPPLDSVLGEVEAAINELGKRRVGLALRKRFASTDITVSDRYGGWDEDQRKVVPA